MRRHRRTRPRPVIPPAQRPRPTRPAEVLARFLPRDLIDELLAVPPGSVEESQIWDRYLECSAARRVARLRDEEV